MVGHLKKKSMMYKTNRDLQGKPRIKKKGKTESNKYKESFKNLYKSYKNYRQNYMNRQLR